jgi:hypothetical protein
MWSAYLFKTTTGEIGPRVAFESMDWSIELNGVETINMRFRKSELPTADARYWLSPWWAGVVLFWDDKPVVAGPIITRPSESFNFVTVGCGGIRTILAKRFVIDEFVNWDDLPRYGNVSRFGLSLGTIASEVVRKAQGKPGGKLPISYAVPDTQGIHERNYRGFNISTLSADEVLTKLSNVINGPDIMFKPRILRPGVLTFDFWTGTDAQPRIAQKHTPVWDTTPEKGQVSEMNITTTGTYQTSRVFAVGTGQDEGTMIKMAQDMSYVQKDYPMLETTFSDGGSSENPEVVWNHAKSNLDANIGPLEEIQMTVRGDTEIPLGEFWPGDLVEIITKGWLALPDGKTQMRLLSMTGDHTANVKVSLQKEDKFT